MLLLDANDNLFNNVVNYLIWKMNFAKFDRFELGRLPDFSGGSR